MKVFAVVFAFIAGAIVSANCSSYAGGAAPAYGGGAAPSYGGGASSYGASIPAPPCPKNYLFSCQPSLSPAPCAQPAGGYGSQGAYSENVPSYVFPVDYSQGGYQGYNGIQGLQGIQY